MFTTLLIFCSIVFAGKVDVQGNVDWKLKYDETVNISTKCNEEIIFVLPNDAKNIDVMGLNFSEKNVYNISGCWGKFYSSYSFDDAIKKENNQYRLERVFTNFDEVRYSVKIPFNFRINKNQTFPENYSVKFSDDENFKIINFSQSSEIYLIYFEEIKSDKSYSNMNLLSGWEVYFIGFIFFILGFSSSYGFLRMRGKQVVDDDVVNDVPPYVLLQEEKDIIDVIRRVPGINQKQIGRNLNLSKAKVSYVINDLEQKKLIKRLRFGRSFKVYLNKTNNNRENLL